MMDAWEDLLVKYYLDVIGNIALSSARKFLEQSLQTGYGLEGMSFMSSRILVGLAYWKSSSLCLPSWRRGNPGRIYLNGNCLMIPAKSLSGIYFPTEVPFISCQLCDRNDCPGRKAAYDRKIKAEFGGALGQPGGCRLLADCSRRLAEPEI